ncbi:hypothetical protein [Siccirubricoccus phaeus]|uniref:hypothetical protein n=1 Tax=Siccirubricoccus phaeus TaxID=2595053 RepID=UPI00165ACD8C|nr:hypothetical protein [Siccirubricoccus phaeus]
MIERAGKFLGFSGWVEDPAQPGMPIGIEVLAGDIPVAAWRAEPEPGEEGRPGRLRFRIPRAALQTPAATALRGLKLPLQLRLAGGGLLESQVPLPLLGDMVDAVAGAGPDAPLPAGAGPAERAPGTPEAGSPSPGPEPPAAIAAFAAPAGAGPVTWARAEAGAPAPAGLPPSTVTAPAAPPAGATRAPTALLPTDLPDPPAAPPPATVAPAMPPAGAAGAPTALPAADPPDLPAALAPAVISLPVLRVGPAQPLPALPASLAAARAAAAALPETAPAKEAGFIEAFGAVPGGPLWLFGWMRPEAGLLFPCRIGETALAPAGMAIAWQSRADLPEGAVAFAAALDTAWRPSGDRPRPRLRFGAAGQAELRTLGTSQFLEPAACAQRLAAGAAAGLQGHYLRPLLRLSAATNPWAPDAPEAAALGLKAHVDRLLVVPGFGALVQGWSLSPAETLQPRLLRLGEEVLPLVPHSLTRLPRPDLLEPAGGATALVEGAGFLAAFRGQATPEALQEASLRFATPGGLGLGHRIAAPQLRVIGHSAAPEELLQIYPGLEHEPFFPDLARAVAQAALAGAARAEPLLPLAAAPAALILALGPDRADAALLLAELGLLAARRPGLPPLVLLLGSGAARATALAGLAEIGLPAAVFALPDAAQAPHALPGILASLGTERFALVGPGAFPNAAGWEALLGALAAPSPLPLALPWRGEAAAPYGAAGLAAFAWRRAEFLAWLAGQPPLLGGMASLAPCLPAARQALPAGAAALPGRRRPAGRLARAVDRLLTGGGGG